MSVSPILTTILEKRGIVDVESFLHPKYSELSNPFMLHDMDAAVIRVINALQNNERIAIYSDYDADGIPGAVVLTDFFKLVRHDNYTVYIPHRHDEGYGLHTAALDILKDDNVSLLITCDLGITAAREVAHAVSIGMEVIVTDHHESDGGELPKCLLVHPKLGNYADPMICGCAVAFQLVRALIARLREVDSERVDHIPDGYEKWMLDLVGLSTIADMVPLQKENRILATYGLKVLRQTRRAGLRALALQSRANLLLCDETMIGFRIVPYINAASRMETPMLAYNLIADSDEGSAYERARYLNSLNTLRRSVVDEIMKTAHVIAQSQSDRAVLWVGSADWHVGVLSIIAGRISEEYGKPVFVWTGHGEEYLKGSTRGVDGFNVLETMLGAPDHIFKKRGGHAGAGGFTMVREHTDEFVNYLSGIVVPPAAIERAHDYDISLPIGDINSIIVRDLDKLRPFGVGNREPRFLVMGRLIERKIFGKTSSHEKLLLADEMGNTVWLLLFSSEREQYNDWKIGDHKSIIVTIEESGSGRYLEVVARPVK